MTEGIQKPNTTNFKITTWEGYNTMQLRKLGGNIFLEADEVQKLREHLNEAAIEELERRMKKSVSCFAFDKEDIYEDVISLLKGGGR